MQSQYEIPKNYYEFFAGVGLVRKGLESEGWQCIWANDICADKKNAYQSNFDDSDFELKDIWEITQDLSSLPREVFLATASFPCTDLSVAGTRKGLKGKQSSTLKAFFSIVESLKDLNQEPKCILLENVQGFLTSNKGADVSYTVKALNQLGYVVDLVEVDARYFTPQSRPRIFIIAVKESIAEHCMDVEFSSDPFSSWSQKVYSNPILRTRRIQIVIKENSDCKWGLFDIPSPPALKLSLSDVVEKLEPTSPYWWNEDRVNKLFSQMYDRHKDLIHTMRNSDTYQYGTVYRRVRQGQSRAELRTDGIAGCLRAPKGGSSKQILVQAGKGEFKVRFLTPREYARLQGVEDDFILPERDTAAYFAMGDAVCVPALTWLTKHSLCLVYEAYKECLKETAITA